VVIIICPGRPPRRRPVRQFASSARYIYFPRGVGPVRGWARLVGRHGRATCVSYREAVGLPSQSCTAAILCRCYAHSARRVALSACRCLLASVLGGPLPALRRDLSCVTGHDVRLPGTAVRRGEINGEICGVSQSDERSPETGRPQL
jgi:hypothetical protein